ncbi:DUF748 domain-containing protein [Desulfosarcina ovata]|uniref:Flagellar motor protein MotB n=1 Tax=Desulfosarcina ovata subsp. ovata TaxID=2752305 RepID=A0A5K8ABN6_9BACT|nr:DUF748 domain-containing protein [Desulfosarcina ovata]BBO90123.1 flagellar motor protein MotB [Desulfosarcina ovata subsp. ovata]
MIKTADLTPRQKKLAIGLGAALLIYLLFGFIAAPFILRSVLEKKVAGIIHRQVAVEAVRVNPITLSVTLRGLDVRETDGAPFVKLGEAYVNLQTSSLFKWALVLKTVRLVDPEINLIRSGEATFNFSDIGAGGGDPPDTETAAAESGGFNLAIYDARISGGRITVDDRVVAVSHRIEGLNLRVTDFSSRPADVDVYTLLNLSARVNDADFFLDGKSRPFSPARDASATIGLESVDLPHYLPYMPIPEGLALHALIVDLENDVDFQMDAVGHPDLTVAGVISLSNLQLAHGDGTPLFNQGELKLDLLPSALLTGQVRLAQVDLTAPELFLERLPSGALKLPLPATRADDPAADGAAAGDPAATAPRITIDRLNLEKGVVHFTDRANRTVFTTTVNDLGVTVDNFGLNSDRTAAYQLALKTEVGEAITLKGTAALAPLQATGEIALADLDLSRYGPYYQDRFDFKTVDGRLSLGTGYRFRQTEDGPLVSLAGGYVNIDALKMVAEDDDASLVSLAKLRVSDTTADLNQREITIGSLDIAGGQLACRREKDGVLNLASAFVPAESAEPAVNASPQPEESSASTGDVSQLVLTLNTLSLSDFSVDVEDRVPAKPAKFRLDNINFTAEALSTAAGKTGKADLALRWQQGGQITVGGTVALTPPGLDLAVTMKQMDIRPFQPYLSEQAGLIVTQGFFNTQGRLKFSQKQGAEPAIAYRGKAGLTRFASIDRKNADDFLKWDALQLAKMEVATNPTRLSIDQISLSDFFARVIVDPEGSVNLVSMFASTKGEDGPANAATETAPAPHAPAAHSTAPMIKIAQVSLRGGEVDFSDNFIKPHYSARFNDLGGRISGLESIAEKRADVLLEGMWGKQAPVKISGQINPLIDNPYVDLKLNISDIELSPFSPYSGKYIGYILDKGKLTFNVDYLMEDRRLEGKNSIYIDQLTLGNTVESPEAVNLPIKLAIALLKDRAGNIALDLPVSGDLDDPQFKIGKVILTVLKNLIVKIVTSPFAALGSLVGGGEELSYLDFTAGISDISAENAEKIDKLTKILYERPGLKLDIQGTAGTKWDSDALRKILLDNRLKAIKLQQMMKSGESAVPLEEIVLGDAERAVLIETAFAESGIAAPLDSSGKPIEVTLEEMEKLLRTHTVVTPDDYRELANARAFNTKDYLLEKGQVERERVFIVEPQVVADGDPANLSGSGQVVFSLK